MQEQLDRIEAKIDALAEARLDHNGRLVRLETQAGFVKASVAIIVSVALAAFSWALGRTK